MPPDYRTRFAPSPTGYLHLGHAYSALTAQARAQTEDGTFLLRIEDTDHARCRPEFEAAIFEDLQWLGLSWPNPVLRQSEHPARYQAALDLLTAKGLTYPCCCTRSDIRAALLAPQEGATPGPYPGTCRGRSISADGTTIRLDLQRALERIGANAGFLETGPERAGWHALDPGALLRETGDVVLARRDTATASYHLAVVVDDALQRVTEVVRGMDLFEASGWHVILQNLLELQTPIYHHHGLIRDDAGKRLAKRDDARALHRYRAEGATPQDIRRMVGL